jgi:hypothetical protein
VNILVLLRCVEEQVRKWLGAPGVNSVVIAIDLVNSRDGKILNPIFEVFFGDRRDWVGVFRLMFIERTIDNDGGGCNPGCFNGILVCCNTKKIIVSVSVSSCTKFSGGCIR